MMNAELNIPDTCALELQTLRRWMPNILMVGADHETTDLLPLILSYCRQPVVEGNAREGRWPPVGTLLLRNVGALDLIAQRSLHQWLDDHPAHVQVVSLAPASPFPLVSAGAFSAALFYRLNTVTVTA